MEEELDKYLKALIDDSEENKNNFDEWILED